MGSNNGCGDSTGRSILSSLDTLLYTASMPPPVLVPCSLCLREASAMLGMTMGMAKIVRALKCLEVPCKCEEYHIQHQLSRLICVKSAGMGTTAHCCLTSPAVSVAELTAD